MPAPRAFYEREFTKLTRERKGWRQTKCPFHDGQSPTSLSLNMTTGGFYCFSCQAKGGSLIDFVMRRDQCDFKTACQTLGAWDEHAKPVKQSTAQVIVGRDLVMDLVIDGEPCQVRTEIPEGDYLTTLRRAFHFAQDQLDLINAGQPEEYDGEAEVLWQLMADAHELIRREEQRQLGEVRNG